MSTSSENTPKKSSRSKKVSRSDPSRFSSPGINYKGKLIGVEDVPEARGDMMCQVAMAKLKAAVKTIGDHKQKIIVNVSLDGVKIIDEKSEAPIHCHPVSRISFISRDLNDSRAFGYVFGQSDGSHQFYGIKTEKVAEGVVLSLRDLFQIVYNLKKQAVHHTLDSYPSTEHYSDVKNCFEQSPLRTSTPPGGGSLSYHSDGWESASSLSHSRGSSVMQCRYSSTPLGIGRPSLVHQGSEPVRFPQTMTITLPHQKQGGSSSHRQHSIPLKMSPLARSHHLHQPPLQSQHSVPAVLTPPPSSRLERSTTSMDSEKQLSLSASCENWAVFDLSPASSKPQTEDFVSSRKSDPFADDSFFNRSTVNDANKSSAWQHGMSTSDLESTKSGRSETSSEFEASAKLSDQDHSISSFQKVSADCSNFDSGFCKDRFTSEKESAVLPWPLPTAANSSDVMKESPSVNSLSLQSFPSPEAPPPPLPPGYGTSVDAFAPPPVPPLHPNFQIPYSALSPQRVLIFEADIPPAVPKRQLPVANLPPTVEAFSSPPPPPPRNIDGIQSAGGWNNFDSDGNHPPVVLPPRIDEKLSARGDDSQASRAFNCEFQDESVKSRNANMFESNESSDRVPSFVLAGREELPACVPADEDQHENSTSDHVFKVQQDLDKISIESSKSDTYADPFTLVDPFVVGNTPEDPFGNNSDSLSIESPPTDPFAKSFAMRSLPFQTRAVTVDCASDAFKESILNRNQPDFTASERSCFPNCHQSMDAANMKVFGSEPTQGSIFQHMTFQNAGSEIFGIPSVLATSVCQNPSPFISNSNNIGQPFPQFDQGWPSRNSNSFPTCSNGCHPEDASGSGFPKHSDSSMNSEISKAFAEDNNFLSWKKMDS